MKFDLKRPCDQCPFRIDALPGWIGRVRATEIAQNIANGGTFACHKTLVENEEGSSEVGPTSQMCAGALICMKRSEGGFHGAASFAAASGAFKWRELDTAADVFQSYGEFIEHHSEDKEPQF